MKLRFLNNHKLLCATLIILAAVTWSSSTVSASDYSLNADPNYDFGTTPPDIYQMASAIQQRMNVTVSVVGTSAIPYENTAYPPVTGDSDLPPYTTVYGPSNNGAIKNLNLNTVVASGITSCKIRYAGTDLYGGVQLNRFVLRAFTSTQYYDVLVKVFSANGGSAVWSFYQISAPRGLNALLNISARATVGTGQNVLFGGFYVSGNDNKKVLIRGIGPSLANYGISGSLQDPYLELKNSSGQTIGSNNDWQDSQSSEIQATGAQPSDSHESAIIATLAPGSYTTILSGVNSSTGVGTCEIYDLNQAANSQLVNLSGRAVVGTGDNALFAGLIIGTTTDAGMKLIVRAIGPSLGAFGVSGALQDPTLELRDGNGSLLASNDNWRDSQQSEVQASGVQPSDDHESAIVINLQAGFYTAVVRGLNNTTGVGVVDTFKLQ